MSKLKLKYRITFTPLLICTPETEAHYIIDGLLHNQAIKSDIHFTDTHGYSEAVFAVMYLIEVYFAPRIKGVKHATL